MCIPAHLHLALLERHAVEADDKLGQGEEAEVYALGPDRVLKLFSPAVESAALESREAFYASLERSGVPFAVPRVLAHGEWSGIRYAIEARIPGSTLSRMLPRLDGAARDRALVGYAEAATQVARIGHRSRPFGEILSLSPLVADRWSSYLLARSGADLHASRGEVSQSIERPERALERLARWLAGRPEPEPGLVHGDFHPANVMVDDAGRVTGVIDFGGLTLCGDPRLDQACALLSLAGLDGATAVDRQLVSNHLGRRGLRDEDVRLYALFYAFRFLQTAREDLIRWCLDTIRTAC